MMMSHGGLAPIISVPVPDVAVAVAARFGAALWAVLTGLSLSSDTCWCATCATCGAAGSLCFGAASACLGAASVA